MLRVRSSTYQIQIERYYWSAFFCLFSKTKYESCLIRMYFSQGCILLTSLSVISSKFIQKFAQKCQYFTLIDQSLPPDNCYIPCLLREESALALLIILVGLTMALFSDKILISHMWFDAQLDQKILDGIYLRYMTTKLA